MRNYNYTARDTSGATKRGSLQASDRNAALHELTTRGLVPLSVDESATKIPASGQVLSRNNSRAIWFTIGFVLVGLMVWYIFVRSGSSGSPKRQGKREPHNQSKQPVKQQEKPPKIVPTNKPEVLIDVKTNQTADLIKKSNTPLADERYGTNRVKSGRPPSRGDGYSYMTERYINMVINTKLGMTPLPLFKLPKNEDIGKMLQTDIIVYDTDEEKQIEQKANVAKAKEILKEYLSKGGTTAAFIEYYHGVLADAAAERSVLQQQMLELTKKGDYEAASLFMEEANKTLAAKGYILLKPTPSMRQK